MTRIGTWTLLLCTLVFSHSTSAQDYTNYTQYFTDFLLPSPRRDLAFPDLVRYDGYPCETHYPVTEDGYILGCFRIFTAPQNASCPADYKDRVPIILVSGLFLSGDSFITPGPHYSHAYNLADDCHDVWVANPRGNRYSRNHTTMDPNTNSSFWKFSFHEMGTLDMPAIIDYVLRVTNKTQVAIGCHSQGGTATLILCSERQEYNAKIKIGFGMSPTAWLDHAKFIIVIIQGIFAGLVDGHDYTDREILKYDGPESAFGKFLCGLSALQYPVCQALLFAAMGYDRFQIKPRVMKDIPGHFLAGTSMRTFVHWGQVRNHGFRKYDYGETDNLKIYGQIIPPLYDLSKVTMKWIFFGAYNDYVADLEDVRKLVSNLSNAVLCILKDINFGHLDFIYADNQAVYIVPQILRTLASGNFTCNEY